MRELSATEEVLPPDWAPEPQPIEFPTERATAPPSTTRRATATSPRPRASGRRCSWRATAARPSCDTGSTLTSVLDQPRLRVVDVNYGGSTGLWPGVLRAAERQVGVVDIDDCVTAPRTWLSGGRRRPAGDHGGSAGGYTTLGALAFQ